MEYFLSILNNLVVTFFIMTFISCICSVASVVCYVSAKCSHMEKPDAVNLKYEFDMSKLACKISIPICIVSAILLTITPTRNSLIKARLMMVGSEYVTKDQVDLFIKAIDNKVDKIISSSNDKSKLIKKGN